VPNYFSRVCFFIFIVRRNSYHFQQAAAISTAEEKEKEWKKSISLNFIGLLARGIKTITVFQFQKKREVKFRDL
jgi:hypothetical protein